MNRVLNSWKEIASYVGRGVRTVQRWEKELKFPVRRPRGRSRSAVIAMSDEIDRWLTHAASRSQMDAATPKLDSAVWTSTHLKAQALVETALGLQAATRELQKSLDRTIELARRNTIQRRDPPVT